MEERDEDEETYSAEFWKDHLWEYLIHQKIIMSGVGESGSESRNENFCKLWKSDQVNYRWKQQRGKTSDRA